MFFRQLLNYFVCTLQQYVQSQLSHVSWCNFIQSLRNQVLLFLTQSFADCLSESCANVFFCAVSAPTFAEYVCFFQIGHRYTGSGVFAYVLPSRCTAHVSDNVILWCQCSNLLRIWMSMAMFHLLIWAGNLTMDSLVIEPFFNGRL